MRVASRTFSSKLGSSGPRAAVSRLSRGLRVSAMSGAHGIRAPPPSVHLHPARDLLAGATCARAASSACSSTVTRQSLLGGLRTPSRSALVTRATGGSGSTDTDYYEVKVDSVRVSQGKCMAQVFC
jgi:hypothetical protein